MLRLTPLARKSGLVRSGGTIKRRTRLRPVSANRRRAKEEYDRVKLKYLTDHPFCQIFIAEFGLDEADVIARGGDSGAGFSVPASQEIHHRNKRSRSRLNDQRWWMAASRQMHDRVEANKAWAREKGYLLPLEADADGATPSGIRALETPLFMRKSFTMRRERS